MTWRAILLCLGGVVGAYAALGCEPTLLEFYPPSDDTDSGGPPPQAPAVDELVVHGRLDLSSTNTGRRACEDGGDAVAYRVSALQPDHARLRSTPSAGCLQAGDEVLLIKLQGNAAGVAQVGEHELLRIAAVAEDEVTFVSDTLRHYGATLGKDDALDAGVVLLQRVPSYSRLEVPEGAVLTAGSWNGIQGGVLTLRVLGDSVLDGRIDLSGMGFRGAPSTEPALGHGLQGESLGGAGAPLVEPNRGGGGGGLGDQTTTGCVQDGNAGGGGGHQGPGSQARVLDLCSGEGAGRAGNGYAEPGLLFLGSGGGAGGVDNVRADNPAGGAGGSGGGIVWLLSQSLSGSGSIVVDGGAGVGDEVGLECQGGSTAFCYDHSGPGGGGAGGSIRVTAPVIRGVTLSAAGGPGGNGNDAATGDGGQGAAGMLE